jgi:hypothetical protein
MTESNCDIFVYEVVQDGSHRYYVTPLPHEHGFATGLPAEAIMGELIEGFDRITPESFVQNPQFIELLAAVIGNHAHECPGLVAEANRQQEGYVVIVDRRTSDPDGAVPPEDIIGLVEIERGQLLRYHASPNYRILTKDGFMQLDRFLHDRLIEELAALAR